MTHSNADEVLTERTDLRTVLSIRGLRKEFNGVVAVDSANIDVRTGEIVGLVGPNGAGKTTIFNCVMGTLSPEAGSVTLMDEDITGMGTSNVVQRGLSRTFQIPRVFPELTVRENMVANQRHRGESVLATVYRRTDDETQRRIDELLSFVGLREQQRNRAGELSTGQQKLLNLASALLADPDVVLLDEPTAGVNPALVEALLDMLLELNERGRTFLVIEHDMDVIYALTDYVYVLASGTNLTEGSPEETLSDPRVLEAYFGE